MRNYHKQNRPFLTQDNLFSNVMGFCVVAQSSERPLFTSEKVSRALGNIQIYLCYLVLGISAIYYSTLTIKYYDILTTDISTTIHAYNMNARHCTQQ